MPNTNIDDIITSIHTLFEEIDSNEKVDTKVEGLKNGIENSLSQLATQPDDAKVLNQLNTQVQELGVLIEATPHLPKKSVSWAENENKNYTITDPSTADVQIASVKGGTPLVTGYKLENAHYSSEKRRTSLVVKIKQLINLARENLKEHLDSAPHSGDKTRRKG